MSISAIFKSCCQCFHARFRCCWVVHNVQLVGVKVIYMYMCLLLGIALILGKPLYMYMYMYNMVNHYPVHVPTAWLLVVMLTCYSIGIYFSLRVVVSASNLEQGFGMNATATDTTQSIGEPGCVNLIS